MAILVALGREREREAAIVPHCSVLVSDDNSGLAMLAEDKPDSTRTPEAILPAARRNRTARFPNA